MFALIFSFHFSVPEVSGKMFENKDKPKSYKTNFVIT